MRKDLIRPKLFKNLLLIATLILVSINLVGCIDPVQPEFEFKENLIFIEALASTEQGASFVSIRKSVLDDRSYRNDYINDADVSFKNTNTNELVYLDYEKDVYKPPVDFIVSVGESWELYIVLFDGTEYRSLPEKVLKPIPSSNLKATYKSDLIYREDLGDFVPGHIISVDINDPEGEENYYYWGFRSFEKIGFCVTCNDGIFREGACELNPQFTNRKPYYDYYCESDCWRIRFNESVETFSDKFSDGKVINKLPVADVLLYSKENILVEVQQFSLSPSAHEYYKVLKDIVDNSRGFNAPPPAALIGNLFNHNNSEEFVLGRFTATSTRTKTIFIERENIAEDQIEKTKERLLEECREVCPPNTCFTGLCDAVSTAPCVETRFKTGIAPEGWLEL